MIIQLEISDSGFYTEEEFTQFKEEIKNKLGEVSTPSLNLLWFAAEEISRTR